MSARLAEVRERIAAAAHRAGRRPEEVVLVAVTKGVSAARVREAWEAGVLQFGENRVQEARMKIPEVACAGAEWHMIGHLQTNKAREAASLFDCVQSLDRPEIVAALDREAARRGRPVRGFLQVNPSREATKHGLWLEDVPAFLEAVRAWPGVAWEGVMAMAPFFERAEEARPVFRRVRELWEGLRRAEGGERWRWCSMGMSHDFEAAVEEGANMVRVGTALFGPRS